MSILTFDELMKLTTKERSSRMTKDQLLESINTYSYQYKYNISEKEAAQKALVTQSNNEEAVKSLLIGYLNLPTEEKSQYGDMVKIKYNLLDLVGKLLATK